MNKKLIFPIIVLILFLFVMAVIIVSANNQEIGEDTSFSGIIQSVSDRKIVLEGGQEYRVDKDISFDSSIENLELTNEFFEGNYISGTYNEQNSDKIVSEININVMPIFKGEIIEVYSNEAIVVPSEDEYYIRSSADQVYVKLPDNHEYSVGSEITVKYDGRLMESYPLQIVTLSVDGIPIN